MSATAGAFGLETLVKLDSGWVSGTGVAVRSYKGIPYAAPPVGDLRWKPPQPLKPWNGIKGANEFMPSCPQTEIIPGRQNENCLGINVWTPERLANAKLPVMVWIHGGGFVIGSGSQSVYDGTALASKGVVVVTFNYRLGVLGFLAHPQLSAESSRGVSGNYGLLDMVAALQWVKRNIAAFGGDPENVTIFGESAGGTAVCLLLVMPDAKDLFHKAISESAAWMFSPTSHLKQSWYGRVPQEKFGEKVGSDIAALRNLSVADLMKKGPSLIASGDATDRGEMYTYAVDGVVIPDDPARLFESGTFHHVPLIAGTNADEGVILNVPVRTVEGLKQFATKQFPGSADAVLAAYPAANDAEANQSATKLYADALFLTGTRGVLRDAVKANPNTYQYYFTRVHGVGRRIKRGSFHAAEIPYVFGTLPDSAYGMAASFFGNFVPEPGDYDHNDATIAAAMSGMWAQFAKTANPNLPVARQLTWPAFGEGESYLEFGDRIVAGKALRKQQLDVLIRYADQLRKRQAAAAATSAQ
jgi:para-nitrobenzyl esterase